ncbi:MAG: hypothetical protein EBS56_11630 [Planctomycetia bacterium]|nr:hypothetical protein [Planctomycetia bacterium]
MGRGVVGLVTGPAPLVSRTQDVRSAIAAELGVVVPTIAFRDDVRLPDRGYRISIAGESVRVGELARGEDGPAAVATLAESLTEAIRERADTLLTRDAVARLVETLRTAQPAVVGQIVPDVLSLAKIQRTLQCLLRDGLPIRPLAELLEHMADHADVAADPVDLAEAVRRQLLPALLRRVRDPDGRLVVIRLTEPAAAALATDGVGPRTRVEAEVRRAVRPRLDRHASAVLVVPAQHRRAIRDRVARVVPGLVVLAAAELAGEQRVDVFASIGEPDATPVADVGRAA